MKYESNIKTVGYPQASVYAKLSDLSNLSVIKERMKDPIMQQKIREQIPGDKMESVEKYLDSMQVSPDSVSIEVVPIGNLAIRIVEREEPKCVKFQSTNSPIGFKLWIQVLPQTDTTSKMKVTVDADINPFMKMMVEKPLKEGIEKLAEMLSNLPYE